MKKIAYKLIFTIALFSNFIYAQKSKLPDGTIAPDFTFTDLKGVSHNLYTYLNQGKYVAIDVSATWCPPCWEYHSKTKTMDHLYETHDTPGDNKWKVLFVEADKATTDASVKGTGSNTQGDWTKDTPFPIMNPPSGTALTNFYDGYKVPFFPYFVFICPNKKVYTSVMNNWDAPGHQMPSVKDWESMIANCGTTGIDNMNDKNPLTIYPNPVKDEAGLYFNLNSSGKVQLQVVNLLGETVAIKDFGLLTAGDQSLRYSASALGTGMYFFIINASNTRYIAKKVMVQ